MSGSFPVLQTERLDLRLADPQSDHDCQDIVTFYEGFPRINTIDEVRDMHLKNYLVTVGDELLTRSTRPPGNFFLISLREQSERDATAKSPIGFVSFFKKDGGIPYPEMGYLLSPQFRGKGYMVEAASRVLEFWRDQMGVREMMLVINDDNRSSRRVAEQIGFTRKGTFTELSGEGPDEVRTQRAAYLLPSQQWIHEGMTVRRSSS